MRFALFVLKRIIKSKKDSRFFSFNSVISTGGIALGVAVLILALSILYGFEDKIEEKIIDFNAHITISGFGQINLPFDKTIIDSIKKKSDFIVKSVSPFLIKNAVIKHKKLSEGFQLEGISPKFDNSQIKNLLIQGKYFSERSTANEIILGEKLANKLMLKVGDNVTVFTLYKDAPPSFDNPPAIEIFNVRGIYRSGMAEYDDLKAYTTLQTMQNITGLKNFVSGYYLKLNDIKKIFFVRDVLQNWLGYPYYVRSLYKTHANIFTWLDLQKKPVPLILGLIILVAAFNIIGTLLMNVLHNMEAIGILRTLGAKKNLIRNIFVAQGLTYSLIGITLGNILAFAVSYFQAEYQIVRLPSEIYFISSVPIVFDWKIYLIISLVTLTVALLAAFIPGSVAAKLEPVKTLRFK